MIKLLALLALLTAVLVLHADQGNVGSIQGIVVDEHGKNVAGAWVSASGTKPLGGRIPGARTDDTGHFAIHSLDWDEYGLQACKEKDDVPCGPFFYRGETKEVKVTPENPSVSVEIRLGLKGGAIVWLVRDESTGKLVPAIFTFRPLLDPMRFVSGYFQLNVPIFIPASIDFSLDVSANGYKTWSYAHQHHPPQPLRLAPGAHKRLDIKLEPLH